MVTELARWVSDVIYSFGYAGVFVLVALPYLSLPVPTELTLPFAGFLVGQGRFSFVPLLAAATAGAVTSSLVVYYLGLWIGEKRLRLLVKRVERFKLVSGSDIDKASAMFERHGGKAIFIGHLLPGVGAVISIPAGLTRMPILGRFLLYTVLGCAVWNGTFILLGWVLGSQWMVVQRYMPIFHYVVLGAVAGGILWFLRRRWRARGC